MCVECKWSPERLAIFGFIEVSEYMQRAGVTVNHLSAGMRQRKMEEGKRSYARLQKKRMYQTED